MNLINKLTKFFIQITRIDIFNLRSHYITNATGLPDGNVLSKASSYCQAPLQLWRQKGCVWIQKTFTLELEPSVSRQTIKKGK